MLEHIAACSCCALAITARGEPLKVSACHCRACRRRKGSAFSVAVFYERGQTTPSGPSRVYSRLGDSGLPVAFQFCPACGVSVFWYPAFRPDRVAIALGCFADPPPPGPTQAVYEQDRLGRVSLDLQ